MSAITKIGVFNGGGIHDQSTQGFIDGLKEVLPVTIQIEPVSPDTIRKPGLEKKYSALFFGAGTGSDWDKMLGDEGRKNIHDFVFLHGGVYGGTCCSAMYVSKESHFEKFHKQRGIDFFPGKATGPLRPVVGDYRDIEAATAEKVHFTFGKKALSGYLYNQGGCYFEVPETLKNVEIIGRLEDGKPAAVLCKAGKGLAFLLGPHMEFSPEPLEHSDNKRLLSLGATLRSSENFRKALFEEVAKILKLKPMVVQS